MKKRILVVDDEKDIVEVLKYNLTKEGYDVFVAYNGNQALAKLDKKVDLIILDLMMPELDGIETCKKIRENSVYNNISIIFLTARNTEADELNALEIGADDYLVKPISIKKILAKVKVLLRRDEKREGISDEVLHLDKIEIHPENYTIKYDKEEIYLPKKEFETLIFLYKNRGRIVTRDNILNLVWGDEVYVGARTIDVHIRKIREKFGIYSDYIETIKGVGYRLRK